MTSGEAWLEYGDMESFGWDDVGLIVAVVLVMIWFYRGGYRYFQG